MTIDPSGLIRSLEIEAEDQLRRAEVFRAELESTTAGAESRDGEVMVRVDSVGALIDLRFFSPAESLSLEDLSRVVMETARRAQAKLVHQVGEVVSSLYGSSSETAAFVTGTYASRYPQPDSDEEDDGGSGWHGGRR